MIKRIREITAKVCLYRPLGRQTSSNRAWHLALLLCLCLAAPVMTQAESQEQSEQALEQLKKNIAKVSKWLKAANNEKSGLIRQLASQEREISKVSKEITYAKSQIRKLLQQLNELNQKLIEQKKLLKKHQSFLEAELKAAYVQGSQPALKELLNSDDPQSLARDMTYFSYLNRSRSEKIKNFEDALNNLKATENNILRQRTAINERQSVLENKKQSLHEKTKQRKKTLKSLNASIETRSQELTRLKQDQIRLEQLLKEVEQAIADIKLPDEIRPFSEQKSKLAWPTRGKVIERFGARVAQGQLRSNGIRIQAKDGSKVNAVHYGRVVFSDWLRGFGLLMIIDHGEGYMSLYGNNKSLLRETGDWVNSGDLLAYAGSSGGQQKSGLYFEIRRNGKPQNPSTWLKK